jgi:hypothetical protein
VSHRVTLAALGPFAQRDLARGIRTGRFKVANKRIALFAAGGALLAVMRSVLDGQTSKDAARHHAEGVLRLLGLPAAEAADVAARCSALSQGQGPASPSPANTASTSARPHRSHMRR